MILYTIFRLNEMITNHITDTLLMYKWIEIPTLPLQCIKLMFLDVLVGLNGRQIWSVLDPLSILGNITMLWVCFFR